MTVVTGAVTVGGERLEVSAPLTLPARATFAGDPGPGNTILGLSVEAGLDIDDLAAKLQAPVGAHRKYFVAGDVTTQAKGDAAVRQIVDFARSCHAAGRLPVLSTKVPIKSGQSIAASWQATADGAWDTWWTKLLAGLHGLGKPTHLCAHHEPNSDGPAPTYAAMYERLYELGEPYEQHVTVVPILNGYNFIERNANPRAWVAPRAIAEGRPIMVDNYGQWWTPDKSITTNYEGQNEPYRAHKPADLVLSILREILSWGCPAGLAETGVHHNWLDPSQAVTWIDELYGPILTDPTYARVFYVSWFWSGANSPRGHWYPDSHQRPVMPLPLDRTSYVDPKDGRLAALRRHWRSGHYPAVT